MFINPLSPITFLKISSLKATIFILFVLLLKSNLLRLKGGLIGGLFALILLSGIFISSSLAVGSVIYALKIKNDNKPSDEVQVEDKLEVVNI
tara:strand:+ start:1020 stop:1295 length:276 start_codon:yes stop_codon:yes gene_type:complete